MICAHLVAIGTVITFGVSELLNNNKNRGVEVKKADDRRNNKSEDDHIVTISSPYFFSKNDSRFLVAEIEIRNSSDGYGALLSSNSSSSGSALYLIVRLWTMTQTIQTLILSNLRALSVNIGKFDYHSKHRFQSEHCLYLK
ncbi:MAG: hypothetical protein KBD78_06890 [Oligoflexales bacterium]|nr:hypothetical protein [Oligoflexales bacterium]